MNKALEAAVTRFCTQFSTPIKEADCAECIVPAGCINFIRVQEILLEMGELLDIDTGKQTVTVSISAGLLHSARALAVVQLTGEMLVMGTYAREGLIRQNIAGKALEELKSRVEQG